MQDVVFMALEARNRMFCAPLSQPRHFRKCIGYISHLVCVHAKIHGIALKLSTPPPTFLFAGLDPMLRLLSSGSGVALLK